MGAPTRLTTIRRWLLATLVAVVAPLLFSSTAVAEDTVGGTASDELYWEFYNWDTGEVTRDLPLGHQVEIILASQSVDVRELLPLQFEVRVNGQPVHGGLVQDPVAQCRDATGCSISMPPDRLEGVGGDDLIEVFAFSAETGELLSYCAYDSSGTSLASSGPEPSPSPETTDEPSGTTTTDDSVDDACCSVVTTCWWGWALKLLIVAVFTCGVFLWWRTATWWRWWLWGATLIFVWVPFLVYGVTYGIRGVGVPMPGWWWVPFAFLIPLPWIGLLMRARTRALRWWLGAGVWTAAAVAVLVWRPTTWWVPGAALLGVFWLPFVAYWVFGRARLRPWWRPWWWGALAALVVWVFAWVTWHLWAWLLPVLAFPVLWWFWWVNRGGWAHWRPKLWFLLPWVWLPWLIWGNFFWDPWWYWPVIGFFALVEVAMLFLWWRRAAWWSWWLLWFLVIFLWIPAWLVLFTIPLVGGWGWWWVPLLPWPVAVWWLASWGSRNRPGWWRPWFRTAAGIWGWVQVLVAILAFSSHTAVSAWWTWWGALLLGVFWLPWVGFYLLARALGRPWWRWWLWLVVGAAVVWVFVWWWWVGPAWWWALPAAAVLFLAWWFWRLGRSSWPLWCFVLPWLWLPWFVFAVVYYCFGY